MKGRVLFTASTYSHILHFHQPYLQWFQEQGWAVHVACGGPHAAVPFADETLDLPLKKNMWSLDNFRAAAMLRRKIQQEDYSFISTHTSLAAFFTRLALKGMRKRPMLANMVHGYLFDERTPYPKQKLLLAAEQWTAHQTDLLLAMNQWDYELAQRYHLGKRVVYIPGIGVNFSRLMLEESLTRQRLRTEFGLPEDAFILIYVAEFSKRKSQSVLIHTMELLPPKVMLILAGDGVLRQECQELAQRLGVADRIYFPGYVQDMAAWYTMADAAVSSSRIEGLPFNVMEAMYAGIPVVASDVKGHQDLIADGVTGLLYSYADRYACAAQILRLLESAAFRCALVEQARERVGRYALEQVFPLVMEQYTGLLSLGRASQK